MEEKLGRICNCDLIDSKVATQIMRLCPDEHCGSNLLNNVVETPKIAQWKSKE